MYISLFHIFLCTSYEQTRRLLRDPYTQRKCFQRGSILIVSKQTWFKWTSPSQMRISLSAPAQKLNAVRALMSTSSSDSSTSSGGTSSAAMSPSVNPSAGGGASTSLWHSRERYAKVNSFARWSCHPWAFCLSYGFLFVEGLKAASPRGAAGSAGLRSLLWPRPSEL